MRTLFCVFVLAATALMASADTDVSGKWSGTFDITRPDGQVQNDSAFLVLKQNGTEITGSVGPNETKQLPITKGKIDGNKIAIEAGDEGHTITFALVLNADHITGDVNMTGDGGESSKAKIDVKKQQ